MKSAQEIRLLYRSADRLEVRDENYQSLAAKSGQPIVRPESTFKRFPPVEYLRNTPSSINKTRETIPRPSITNPLKRRQVMNAELGPSLSDFLKVEKSEWMPANRGEAQTVQRESHLLRAHLQQKHFPPVRSQPPSSQTAWPVLPPLVGTAAPSIRVAPRVKSMRRDSRKSAHPVESILEKLRLLKTPVSEKRRSYFREPENTIVIATGGLSTEPTLLLPELSTESAVQGLSNVQTHNKMTTQEVGQTITAVPAETSHVQLLRDVSDVTEKQRAMSSVAAPRAAYSTLILGGDLAFKEGSKEPPHGFPKRPRRLTGDFQSGFPRRPSATQGHLAASFMFGFAAADGLAPALSTGGRLDQFGAPRKLRSSLQTFLPAEGLSQSRLPPLTVEKTGSPLTDSLHVSGQLQVVPVAIPSVTENLPETGLTEGGAAIERASEDLPEQTTKDDLGALGQRISTFERSLSENTRFRSLSIELSLTGNQLENINASYFGQTTTAVFPPLKASESVKDALSTDAARERLAFINRLKNHHVNINLENSSIPTWKMAPGDFDDAVSVVSELGDKWQRVVFLSKTAAEYSKAIKRRIEQRPAGPSFIDIRKLTLASIQPSVGMTEDLFSMINKNGEYIRTVLLPRCDEHLDLVKELQSCVTSIAQLRPETIDPTKIVQLLGIPVGSRVERTVLPGGLREGEYKRRLKSRLLVLVPRLHLRRNTTLQMATSLVTRLCDAAARVTARLIGSEYPGTATGYRELTIDDLFDGLLTGAVFGTPLAARHRFSGIPPTKEAKTTAGHLGLTPSSEGGALGLASTSQPTGLHLADVVARLLRTSGQMQQKALRQILRSMRGEPGISTNQPLGMLDSEALTGGDADADADSLRMLLQSDRGEEVIQQMLDTLGSQEDALVSTDVASQRALLRQLLTGLGAQDDKTVQQAISQLIANVSGLEEGMMDWLKAAGSEGMDLQSGMRDSARGLPAVGGGDSKDLTARFGDREMAPEILAGAADGIERTARTSREGIIKADGDKVEGLGGTLKTSEDAEHRSSSLLSSAGRGEALKRLLEEERMRRAIPPKLLPQSLQDNEYTVRTRLRALFEAAGDGVNGLDSILEAFEDDEEALSTLLSVVYGVADESAVRNILATLKGDKDGLLSELIIRFAGDVDGLREALSAVIHQDLKQNLADAGQPPHHTLRADYDTADVIQPSSGAEDIAGHTGVGGDHRSLEKVAGAFGVTRASLSNVISSPGEKTLSGDIPSLATLRTTIAAVAVDGDKDGLANLLSALASGAEAADLLSEVSAYVGQDPDVAVRSLLNLIAGVNVDSLFQLLDTSSQPTEFLRQVLNMLGGSDGAVGLEKLLTMLSGGNQISTSVLTSLLERIGLEDLLSVLRDNDPSGRDPLAALISAVGGGANLTRLLDSLGGGREAALARLVAASGGGQAGLRALISAVGDTELLVTSCGGDSTSALEMLVRVAGGGESGMSNLLAAAQSSDADPLGALISLLGGGETGLKGLIDIAGGGEAGLTAVIKAAGADHYSKDQNAREAGLMKLMRSLGAGEKGLDVLLGAVAASSGGQSDGSLTALASLINSVGGGKDALRSLLKTAGGVGGDRFGGRKGKDIQRLVLAAGGTSEALHILGSLAGGGGAGLRTLISLAESGDEEDMQSLLEEVLMAAGLDTSLADALPTDADGLAAFIDEAAAEMKRERLTAKIFGNRDISNLEREWRLRRPSRSEALQKKYEQWERQMKRKRKLKEGEETETAPPRRRLSSAVLVALREGSGRLLPWARATDEELISRLQVQLKEKLRKERTRQQMELLRLQQAQDRELEKRLRQQREGAALWERLKMQKQNANMQFRRMMAETQLAAQAETRKRREGQAAKEADQQVPVGQMSEEEMITYLTCKGLQGSAYRGKPGQLTAIGRRRRTEFGPKSAGPEQCTLPYKLSPPFVWSYFDFKSTQSSDDSPLSEADRRFFQKIVALNRPFAKLF